MGRPCTALLAAVLCCGACAGGGSGEGAALDGVSVVAFRARRTDGVLWIDRHAPLTLVIPRETIGSCGLTARWLPARGAPRDVTPDARSLGARRLVRLAPPAGARGRGRLVVGACGRAARFAVEVGDAPDELPGVAQAEALFRDGDVDGALGVLAREAAAEPSPRRQLQYAARRASLLRRSGNPEASDAWLALAEQARALGVGSEALRAVANAAFTVLAEGRLNGAAALLDRLATESARAPALEPRAPLWLAHYRALLASRAGRLAEAHRLLEAAIVEAERTAASRTGCILREELANVRFEHGLVERALDELEQAHGCHVRAGSQTDATRMRLHNSRGWFGLRRLAAGADDVHASQVRGELQQAAQLAASLGEPLEEANILTNLAWLEVLERRFQVARALLTRVTSLDPRQRAYTLRFARYVEARAALEAGAPDDTVLARFRRLASGPDAGEGAGPDLRLLALAGVAQALRAQGKVDLAIAAYRRAVDALHSAARQTLVFGARDRFYEAHESIVQDLVRLLLQQGRAREAFWTLDGARERSLHAIAARHRVAGLSGAALGRWRAALEQAQRAAEDAARFGRTRPAWPAAAERANLTRLARLRAARDDALERAWKTLELADGSPPRAEATRELPALAAGEAALAVARGPEEAVLLCATATDVRIAPARRAALRGLLAGVHHVYVLPRESARGVDLPLRAWLWEEALEGRVTVSTVPSAAWLSGRRGRGRPLARPLTIFADPSSDLPHARAEAATIAAVVPEARARQGSAVQKASLLSALRGQAPVHYAGHMRGDADAPLSESLALAGGEQLRIADLLSHTLRSELVVLSACGEVGELALDDPSRVGLAEAMAALGAARVITTTRSVDDQEARVFMGELYAALGRGATVAQALRDSALAQRARGSAAWDAFWLIGLQ